MQVDSDLLSETLNKTLICWICDFNGIGQCNVSRQTKEEVDRKAESETDANVTAMRFELSEEAVRAKYGDGWSKKKTSGKPDSTSPKPDQDAAQFAEPAPDPLNDDIAVRPRPSRAGLRRLSRC
jgi:hypothetical protein